MLKKNPEPALEPLTFENGTLLIVRGQGKFDPKGGEDVTVGAGYL